MIQILHYVNPHLFFYKFRDNGFDKPLHEMEQKIYGTVYKKVEKPDEIEVGDTVAVLMPHWNRWVRGQLKEVSSDGAYLVWAVDYGVPVVSKLPNVVKLPVIYTKMNVNYPHVHIGGLINCVPAEGTYDFECDKVIPKETSAWSEKANEIVLKAIDCAIQMKFENPVEFRVLNRTEVHRFGQLTCQKPDGSWIDLANCLSNAFVAKITTNDWFTTNVYQMESIRQLEWKTNDAIPVPLNVKVVVSKYIPQPATTDNGALCASNQSIDTTAVAENACADSNVKTGNETPENKANKKPNAPNRFGPFQAGPQTRPHFIQYPPGMMKNIRGSGQMHRGGHGFPRGGLVNRCSTSRDRSYQHHGRMQAQMDQEYFESCFRKPTKQPRKPSSESSSAADDSNDENHDDKPTIDNETKQEEIPKSSNENANEQESESKPNGMENDAVAVETNAVPIPASPATPPPPPPEASATSPAPITTPTQAVDATDADVDKSTNSNDEQKAEE